MQAVKEYRGNLAAVELLSKLK